MSKFFLFFMLAGLIGCKNKEPEKELDKKKIEPKEQKSIVEAISGLTLPTWIKGAWFNSMESNTNNLVFYSFHDEQMTITHGVNFGAKEVQEPYKNYDLKETVGDSTYLIEMSTNDHLISYEFKLSKFDWSKEGALTYAIVENGELLIDHATSCQRVLNRMTTAEN